MKRPFCMEKGYDKIETTKHPGFGRAEERDREKGCEGVGVLLEMREGG